MIKKTKHPSGRGERIALKAKKDKVHNNASPVFKLLQEKEMLDAANKATKPTSPRRSSTRVDRGIPPTGMRNQVE